MKKGLYLIFGNEESFKNEMPGIYKKINSQIKYFEKSNIKMEILFLEEKSVIFTKLRKRLPKELFIKYNINIKMDSLDFIYVRKPFLNSSIVSLLKSMKTNYNCKLCIEIPTYPYDFESKVNIKNMVIFNKDRKYRLKVQGIVDRIITFSDDKSIWGIPTVNICNGVDFESTKAVSVSTIEDLNMIAVATHHYWHGYDRLINGLKEYKEKYPGNINKIKLHIVGDGPAISQYKQMVEEIGLTRNVYFYGNLSGDDLDKVYSKCNIAVDALGRHRSGVFYNSSLKGKEYCAKGLPIISGVRTELDDYDDYKYYYRFPSDESYIDICEVIEFFNLVYNDKQIEVINNIRNFTCEKFDWSKTLLPIINFIDE